MRAQKDGHDDPHGLLGGAIHRAGVGPAYTAAKHGMVAMSHTLNLEEGMNGIRSLRDLPGRGGDADPAQPPGPGDARDHGAHDPAEDMGALIAFIARQPAHVCINEVLISPDAQSRLYRHHAGAGRGSGRLNADQLSATPFCAVVESPACSSPGSVAPTCSGARLIAGCRSNAG